MIADVSSTQIHKAHPDYIAGTSLRHPHTCVFPGGLHTSGFVASRAGALNGCFDERSLTTRCSVILSGECSMRASGQTHHFQTCDIILAHTFHDNFSFENSKEFSALEIHIPLPLLEQMKITSSPGIEKRSLGLQGLAMKSARQLFGYLCNNRHSGSPPLTSDLLVGYGLAMTTLGYAFTAWDVEQAQSNERHATCLEIARQALLRNFDQAPTITQLAAMCGLSPTRFKELFRQQFGCGPYAYYQAHRMKYACHLLQQKNVTQTAMELGYSNVSHFSAAFQRQFGCSPSKWQRIPH